MKRAETRSSLLKRCLSIVKGVCGRKGGLIKIKINKIKAQVCIVCASVLRGTEETSLRFLHCFHVEVAIKAKLW